MSGAIPPFPQNAFTAWCSVKTQGQLYLYHFTFYGGCFGSAVNLLANKCFTENDMLQNFAFIVEQAYSVIKYSKTESKTVKRFVQEEQILNGNFF
jgi:hypothetical protein